MRALRPSVRPVLRPLLRPACLALALTCLGGALTAQIRAPGEPALARRTGGVPTVTLEAPDVAALLAEDAANEASGRLVPLRFGVPLDAPMVVEDLAAWEVSDDGQRLVARLRIAAPGAYSLGVDFAAFELPQDGQVFLYDDQGRNAIGAYTPFNRGPDGALMIEPFPGDALVIEYSQPADQLPELHLAVRGVVYDYKDIFALERGLNQTHAGDESYLGGCSVGVNCPEGDPFPLQKRCTVRTVWGGFLCSGSILNNTAQDETPYLYTANHCGTGSSVVVRFNYQRSGCTSGSAPTGQQMSGATLLDNDGDTDGRLLRLNNAIPDSYDVYYSGWSRSTSSLSFGMSMHHPGGSPKEISIDSNGGGQTTAGFVGIGNVKVWNINFQIGGTQGGSSGSPLFDQNNRVRGTLTGGPEGNCFQNYYGRFHNFWNDDNIGEWLDPLGTGQTNLDGLDPFADLQAAVASGLGPTSGPAGGFTPVTITGSGFDGVSAVTFDGVDALDFEVLGNSSLVATAPAGPALNSVDVAVTDTFGTSTLNNAFFYTANPAPQIDTVNPNTGNVAGGTQVTISGVNVLGVSDVQFDGVSGTGLTILSPTQLRVTTPGMPAGPADVTVFGNGSDSIVGGFSFTSPGAFLTIGVGLAGGLGIPPVLLAAGDLIPGGPGFTLTTLGIPFNAPGVMFLSFSQAALPFKGGTLYSFPIAASFDLLASPSGQVVLGPLPIDPSVPGGTEFVLQQAFVDAAAVAGISMTAGLKIIVGDS